MFQLPQYKILAKLYESTSTLVYRAKGTDVPGHFVLKVLREDFPMPENVARYHREYEITRQFETDGIPKVHERLETNNRPVLVFEDMSGMDLSRLNSERRFTLSEKLRMAKNVAGILHQIHAGGFIHCDIKPANIIYNPDSERLQIIDLGSARMMSQGNVESEILRKPHGTQPYMSPEHTGRVNRAVDPRSDLYSLGVTLYELFSTKLPFETDDLLEMIHAHIARTPKAPMEVKSDIPKTLSDLIMKLLAKNPADRYQSAAGVKADLDQCYRQLTTDGRIDAFPLARKDISSYFRIPEQIYGRKLEKEILYSAFRRVARGGKEMVMVRGAQGLGKTRMVMDIEKKIVLENAIFAYGGYESHGKGDPLIPLIGAFKELIKRVLTEGSENLHRWRERLNTALGQSGQVIVDSIPEAEWVMGPQPDPGELAPAAVYNRKCRALQNFLRVFCRPERPIVLFLDQLHRADNASLEFIASLLETTEIKFLLLIVAFRKESERLMEWLRDRISPLQDKGLGVEDITLKPLDKMQISRMVSGALNVDFDQAEPLADLLLEKTRGNPFFIKEFLMALRAENLIFFDAEKGSWSWDQRKIASKSHTDNVLDLMASNINRLRPETIELLQYASLMGIHFDLKTVAGMCSRELEQTAQTLAEAENGGFIIRQAAAEGVSDGRHHYRFAHDRIQQAFYRLIPKAEKPGLHLLMGRKMLQLLPKKELPNRLLEIVSHLNLGAETVPPGPERLELIRFNLEAAQQAKTSGLFQVADNFAQSGMALTDSTFWRREHETAMTLCLEAMETASLIGAFDEMEVLGQKAMSLAKSELDKMQVYRVRVNACMIRNHWPEAARLGMKALVLFGIHLPDHLDRPAREVACHTVNILMEGRSVEDLLKLPEMTDPQHLAAMQIMTNGYPAYGAVFPDRAPLLVAEQIRLSILNGNAPASAQAYIYFAVVLCAERNIDEAYRFGRLAWDMTQLLNAKGYEASVKFIFNWAIRHWKEHLNTTIDPLMEAHHAAMEIGEVFQSTYALVYRAVHMYLMGQSLKKVDREMEACARILKRLGQTDAFDFIQMYRQVFANLIGDGGDPLVLDGPYWNETETLARESKADNRGRDFSLYFNKLFLNLLFENFEEALGYVEQVGEYTEGFPPVSAFWTPFVFAETLTRLALIEKADPGQRKIHEQKVKRNLEDLEKWQRQAPMNIAQKYLLAKAEMARVYNEPSLAAELYDQAIAEARNNGYLQDEALSNERAAGFYLNRGKTTIGRSYLLEARYAYLKWGATSKVAQLEEKYGYMISALMQDAEKVHFTTPQVATSTTMGKGPDLDLGSAFKAAQALSSEIVLDKLLKRLMRIIMENAGAEKGFLVLDHDGRLTIEAGAQANGTAIESGISTSPDSSPHLSAAIVHYVARTRKVVILENAAKKGEFTDDPYIFSNGTSSVLCLPLVHKKRLTGVIYLENNLYPGAFTADRLETLNWLSSQAAISLENARLYQKVSDYSTWLEGIIAALNVAQEVQQSLLPRRSPSLKGLDIAGRSLYCDETGGDYYDYIFIGDSNRIAAVVGDVSGHGISSALLMSGTRAYLRARAALPGSPAQIITDVNRLVSSDTDETGQFMTLFYLEVDMQSWEMTWVRAGQDPALVYITDADRFEELGGSGLALGIDENWEYSDQKVSVNPGAIVLLATDGVWETHNADGEMFGKKRLREVIRHYRDLSAEDLRQAIVDAVTAFRGDAIQDDDITMVVIKFRRKGASDPGKTID